MKPVVTFERIGMKILARSEKFGITREYEAIAQQDGRYNIVHYENDKQTVASVRHNREAALSSLDEITDTLNEFARSRI